MIYVGGNHEYIGGGGGGVFITSKGYHEYIGRSGDIMIHVRE